MLNRIPIKGTQCTDWVPQNCAGVAVYLLPFFHGASGIILISLFYKLQLHPVSVNHSFKFGVSSCYKFWKMNRCISELRNRYLCENHQKRSNLDTFHRLRVALICMRAEHIENVR